MKTKTNLCFFTKNVAVILTVISFLNLLMSFCIARSFYSNCPIAPYAVWVLVSFVGLEFMLYLCVVPMANLVDSIDKKKKRKKLSESCLATESQENHTVYAMSDEEFHKQEAETKEKLKDIIRLYCYNAMASLLEEEDISTLWHEIENWIDNSAYLPDEHNWKWKKDIAFKPVDACHFIWNIAKRLGMNKGYSTAISASFVKKLFPNTCAKSEVTSLTQNLKKDPNSGYIKIDVPESNNPAFHFN